MLEQETLKEFDDLLEHRKLSAVFQPIVGMSGGRIMGYEGFIRGPLSSPLHMPQELFEAAAQRGRSSELEAVSQQVVLEAFVKLLLPGKVFLNVDPDVSPRRDIDQDQLPGYLSKLGIDADRVVIELTQQSSTYDYDLLREAVEYYRSMDLEVSMDDQSGGFSGLQLWSELSPDHAKLDARLIKDIDGDPSQSEFVRSVQQLAERTGSRVIAEGIETQEELKVLRGIGIAFGQGYYIAPPSVLPPVSTPERVTQLLAEPDNIVYARAGFVTQKTVTTRKLLQEVPPVAPEVLNEAVYDMFVQNPQVQSFAVVENEIPIGLINRHSLNLKMAARFGQALYGRKPVPLLMNASPLIVDKDMSIEELSSIVAGSEERYLYEGFVITDGGLYAGMGTGQALMRELTTIQLRTAQQASL